MPTNTLMCVSKHYLATKIRKLEQSECTAVSVALLLFVCFPYERMGALSIFGREESFYMGTYSNDYRSDFSLVPYLFDRNDTQVQPHY